ncbi:hypothetical protein [Dictyobacter arantiisoli]|uniref:Uncharacterized protein n=1 Tax=Dictyobacter arantiisoli TaxID=2014874 RepID=A0A5A5TEF8_9CHLR|nr:hypothetical protein [Dictyobacter arantiisoli]GCF09463.1 hypothetical protein KDI_30270 [Dictyobacter arantiisoli]
MIRRVPDQDSIKTMIQGIDNLIDTAFIQEKLFSELGVAWAQPGKIVSLRDYSTFPATTHS